MEKINSVNSKERVAIGSTLKAWIDEKGLNQKQFAELVPMPEGYLSSVLNERIGIPNKGILNRFAEILEIPMYYLLVEVTPDKINDEVGKVIINQAAKEPIAKIVQDLQTRLVAMEAKMDRMLALLEGNAPKQEKPKIELPVEKRYPERISIGARIKALREAKKWSMVRLANESGVNKGTLSKLENRTIHLPTLPNLRKLAAALEISVEELILGNFE